MSKFVVAMIADPHRDPAAQSIIYLKHGRNSRGEFKGGYWHGQGRMHDTEAEAQAALASLIDGTGQDVGQDAYWSPEEVAKYKLRVLELPDKVVEARQAASRLCNILCDEDKRLGLRDNASLLSKHGRAVSLIDLSAGRMQRAVARAAFGLPPEKRKLVVVLSFEKGAEIDPEDEGLEGTYDVEITTTGFDGQDAGRALDALHRTVAIACLDYVQTEVYDPLSRRDCPPEFRERFWVPLVEDEDYVGYSSDEGVDAMVAKLQAQPWAL